MNRERSRTKPSIPAPNKEAIPRLSKQKPDHGFISAGAWKDHLPLGISVVFLLLAFVGILNHEMWRDEYQAWMIARDAHSLAEFFQNFKYEGHPFLWYLCLYFITGLTHNPFAMQVFHILVATGFVFVFNRYSSFPLLYKILFTFSYFIFFEYTLICRSYGIGVLLLFSVCALLKNRSANFLLIAILLFLMANTAIYTALLSCSIAMVLVVDFFKQPATERQPIMKVVISTLIVLAGWAIAAWQMYPENNNGFLKNFPETGHAIEGKRISASVSTILTSYFTLPQFKEPSFWETNQFMKKDDSNPVISLLILLLCIFALLHKPRALLLYLSGTCGLIIFFYYTNIYWYRYTGHLFVWLFACFWVADYFPELKANSALSPVAKAGSRLGKPLLLVILSINCIGGIGSWLLDIQRPFSASKEAAGFITQNKLDALPITGAKNYIISTLSGILDKKIYYPNRGEYGSFIIWDEKAYNPVSIEDIVGSIDTLLAIEKTNKLLLVLSIPPLNQAGGTTRVMEHGRLSPTLKFDLLKHVKAGIVFDEKYYIYLVEKAAME